MNDDTQLFTLDEIYKAYFEWQTSKDMNPSYVNAVFEKEFKLFLTQNK